LCNKLSEARYASSFAHLLVVGSLEAGRIGGVDELDLDSHGGEDVVEHGVGSSVELGGGYDVVTGLADVDDGVEDGGSSRGKAETAELRGALEKADALLKDVGSGVLETSVNVSKLGKSEKGCSVVSVLELERGCTVDRNSTGPGGRVWERWRLEVMDGRVSKVNKIASTTNLRSPLMLLDTLEKKIT
jgi:hypothetical protein